MMELLEKAKFVFVAYLRLRCVESTSVVTKRSQPCDNQNAVYTVGSVGQELIVLLLMT